MKKRICAIAAALVIGLTACAETKSDTGRASDKPAKDICEYCPNRNKCTDNAKCEKTVTKHIRSDYLKHTEGMKALYDKRKETAERVFAKRKRNALDAIYIFQRLVPDQQVGQA